MLTSRQPALASNIYDFSLILVWAFYGSRQDHKRLWFQADHTLNHI